MSVWASMTATIIVAPSAHVSLRELAKELFDEYTFVDDKPVITTNDGRWQYQITIRTTEDGLRAYNLFKCYCEKIKNTFDKNAYIDAEFNIRFLL